jgi:hypothetical protein
MRARLWCTVLAMASVRVAWAGPPTAIHTKDGSVFYGELVERVTDDHVTLLLATGATKRISWKDVDLAPLTVLSRSAAPIEQVVGKHVTVKLETGAVKMLEWDELEESRPPAPKPPPVVKADVAVSFTANDTRAVLQRHDSDGGYADLCTTPCQKLVQPYATLRVVVPNGFKMSLFKLRGAHNNQIVASLGSSSRMAWGSVLAVASLPLQAVGIGFAAVASSAATYKGSNSTPFYLPVDNTGWSATAVAFMSWRPES